jgi:sarcosine oxidase subunit beta
MLVPTEPFDKVSHQSPMVVDMKTGFHYRPEGRGLLLAWNDPEETPGFKLNFDHGFIEKILTRGVDRLPCLEEAEVNPKRAWAGLYEMTPDHHPVLGPVKELPGFFLANGFRPRWRCLSSWPSTRTGPERLLRSGGYRPAGLRPFRLRPPASRTVVLPGSAVRRLVGSACLGQSRRVRRIPAFATR